MNLDDYMSSNAELWKVYHENNYSRKDRKSFVNQDEEIQRTFKNIYGDGVNLSIDNLFTPLWTQTVLDDNHVIYNAGFKRGDNIAQVDALVRNGNGWDLVMVTNSKEAKPGHSRALSFIKYCAESSIEVNDCYVVHINGDYTPGSSQSFFKKVNLSDEVDSKLSRMSSSLQMKEAIISGVTKPKITKPIPRLLKKIKSEDSTYNPDIDGRRIIPETVESFLDSLNWPLCFLDFETLPLVKPIFQGTKPYQQVPFQFSVHILEDWNANMEHHSVIVANNKIHHYSETESEYFGSLETEFDPRPGLIEAMVNLFPSEGSNVIYTDFENKRFNELGRDFPKFKNWTNDQIEKSVDLIIPFRSGHIYDPAQEGSASIKKVLPAFTDLSYDHLEIQAGISASQNYYDIVTGKVDQESLQEKIQDGHDYCTLDTLAMVELISVLERLVT